MFGPCFTLLILLVTATNVLPLAHGQSPAGPENGDVFNSTTINNRCYQIYKQTTGKINEEYLRIQAQIDRDQAFCKTDPGCVQKIQQRRIAAGKAADKQVDIAKSQLSACETKPRLRGNGEPDENGGFGGDRGTPAPQERLPRAPLPRGRIRNPEGSGGQAYPTNGGGTRNTPSRASPVRSPASPASPSGERADGGSNRTPGENSDEVNPLGRGIPGGTGQFCGVDPDWVGMYKAEGADPPLRYKTGFYQGVARCMQDQCTIQNLAIAVSAAAFVRVRALLAVATVPGVIDAIVHPPGFAANPDPYARGKDEGSRICNWLLTLSVMANARGPLVGPRGKISIPRGFSFYKALNTIPEWLPKINPRKCQRNCGLATVNSVRVMFGRPLVPAPTSTRGMTDGEMEGALGTKFSAMPQTDVDMYSTLSKMPEGTVAVISAINPNAKGTPPPSGPITDLNNIPGHFFWGVKGNGEFQMWDGQSGGKMVLPGNWIYRTTIVGNPLDP